MVVLMIHLCTTDLKFDFWLWHFVVDLKKLSFPSFFGLGIGILSPCFWLMLINYY